jgi:hypothetical protein
MKANKETLETMLEVARQQAELVLVGGKRELMPVFVLVGPGGPSVHGCPWRNDAEKEIMGNKVRREIKRRKVFQYSFVCEAWAVHLASAKEFHHRPSEDPRRVEVVIALAVNRQEKKIRQWNIERAEDGTCTGLRLNPSFGDEGQLESWMAELLED